MVPRGELPSVRRRGIRTGRRIKKVQTRRTAQEKSKGGGGGKHRDRGKSFGGSGELRVPRLVRKGHSLRNTEGRESGELVGRGGVESSRPTLRGR